MSKHQSATGIDLARAALHAARKAAAARGTTPAKRGAPTGRDIVRRGREAREPQPLGDVFVALVAAHGWTLGTAGGSLRDHWPSIVGPDAATHWHLAGYNPTTRHLRILADSPTWAAQLRLQRRQILTDLEQLRPGTVHTIDVRVGTPPPASGHDRDRDQDDSRHQPSPTTPAPVPRPAPLADHSAYQALRHQMREQAQARQVALDEAAAQCEEILRQHYNRLREPETAHRPATDAKTAEAAAAEDEAVRARQHRQSHQAALAIARATRAGAIPLRRPATVSSATSSGAASVHAHGAA